MKRVNRAVFKLNNWLLIILFSILISILLSTVYVLKKRINVERQILDGLTTEYTYLMDFSDDVFNMAEKLVLSSSFDLCNIDLYVQHEQSDKRIDQVSKLSDIVGVFYGKESCSLCVEKLFNSLNKKVNSDLHKDILVLSDDRDSSRVLSDLQARNFNGSIGFIREGNVLSELFNDKLGFFTFNDQGIITNMLPYTDMNKIIFYFFK